LEFRIALPQTGQFHDLTVGEQVHFGFDPQRAVCFASGDKSTAHGQ
jgi:spermidine/putrescine transport system ATP-binding protein